MLAMRSQLFQMNVQCFGFVFLTLITILEICSSAHVHSAQPNSNVPGIKTVFGVNGLDALEFIAEPIITDYIRSMEPIHFPDIDYKQFVISVNLTKLILFDTKHKTFEFSLIPEVGLQMTLGGFGAKLHYELDYSVLFTNEQGSIQGTATINQTDITMDLAIGATDDGKATVQVQKLIPNIGFIDPGATGVTEEIFRLLRIVIDGVVSDLLSIYAPPMINSELASLLPNLSMTFSLDSSQLVLFDYSLTAPPIFSETNFTLQIRGDIYPNTTSFHSPCPFHPTPNSLQGGDERDVQVYVDVSVPQCLAYSFQQTGLLNSLANTYLHQALHLDNRMDLGLDILNVSLEIISSPPSPFVLVASIEMNIFMDQPQQFPLSSFYPNSNSDGFSTSNDQEHFITFNLNLTTHINVSLDLEDPSLQAGNLSLGLDILDLLSSFAVIEIGSAVPEHFQNEIKQTNMTALNAEANQFLLSTVLPAINSLVSHFPLPFPPTAVFSLPQLRFLHSTLIYLATDISSSSYDSTPPPIV